MEQNPTHKLGKALTAVIFVLMLALIAVGLVACNKTTHEHEYIEVEAKQATCTEDGNIFHYSCSCGKFFDENKQEIASSDVFIAAKGHTPVVDAAVPATCTTSGLTEGSHCSVCSAVLTAQQTVNALGHQEVLTSWEQNEESHWHKCSRCDVKLSESAHSAGDDWIDDVLPKCNAEGRRHKQCICGRVMQEETLPTLPHDWQVSGAVKRCETCGTTENIYERQNGAIIFGEYPQTKVEDDGVIATLSQMSGNKPEKGAHGKWSDYGYYVNGAVDEYAFYIDLEYEGSKYRGVFYTSVRPVANNEPSPSKQANDYKTLVLYWFKWEPITWKILQEESDNIFVMSEIILDSQLFYHERTATRTIDDKTIYPSNYKESDLRVWLNNDFLNWAFDEADRTVIKETLVDNGRPTTGYGSGTDRSQFMCDDTNDKVFLLSVTDVKTYLPNTNARKLQASDYAKCQGVDMSYAGSGSWWLRTANDAFPAGDAPYSERIVSKQGYNTSSTYVNYTNGGVVPALNITVA